MKESKKNALNKILNVYTLIGVLFWVFAAVFILIPIAPQIWYRINPSATSNEVTSLTQNLESDLNNYKPSETIPEKPKLPDFDDSLPDANSISISKIGVNSPITEGSDYENALKNGAWIVNDFATPDSNVTSGSPMIIAAHRFGYIFWDSEQRSRLSFYKLPEIGVGDRVEIVWQKRKYIYEVYAGEENTQITDYNADLILYTCKLYNSPERIIRYAKRINE